MTDFHYLPTQYMNQSLFIHFTFIPITFNKKEKMTNLFYTLKYGKYTF